MKNKIPEKAKLVFKGVLFNIYQWQQKMYDGNYRIFEMGKLISPTQIYATTPENKIILLEEKQPPNKHFFGVPGGGIDEGEIDTLEAAKRELLEETGMVAEEWIKYEEVELLSKLEYCTYYYIAKKCKKIQEPNPGTGEKIKLFKLEFEEFYEKTQDEKFRNKYISNKLFKLKHTNKLKEFKELLFD